MIKKLPLTPASVPVGSRPCRFPPWVGDAFLRPRLHFSLAGAEKPAGGCSLTAQELRGVSPPGRRCQVIGPSGDWSGEKASPAKKQVQSKSPALGFVTLFGFQARG